MFFSDSANLLTVVKNVTGKDFSAFQGISIDEHTVEFNFDAFDAFNEIIHALKNTAFADLLFIRIYDKYDFEIADFDRVSVDSDGNLFVQCYHDYKEVNVSDYYDFDDVEITLLWDIDTVKGCALQDEALGFTYQQNSEYHRAEKADLAARAVAAGSYYFI